MSNGNKKNLGQTLYFSQFGGERSIPDVFVAAMERAEERTSGYTADAEIPQEVKNDPNVVDAYFDTREQRTNEKVLVVVRKKDGNITLRDFRTTDQGQTVQVDSTLFYTIDSTFVRAYPSATQDVAIKDLGNRWSIQEVAVSGTWTTDDPPVFVPGIYQGVELSTRREDPIPSSIRSGLPVEEVQSIVTGTVAQPTLGDDDLEARERQVGEGKKLLSRSSRDAISLPVLERTGKELTDLLPARFRGLIPTARTTTVTEGAVATPTLGTGELVRTEEQVSALVKLVEVISRAGVTFPVVVVDNATITEYGGGPVTITSSIAVNGTYTVDEGEGVVSSKITKLGEGHELKETVSRVAGAWPILDGTEIDRTLHKPVPFTTQVVGAGATGGVSGDVETEIKPIDYVRSQKTIRTFSTSDIDTYSIILHNSCNVDLPLQLTSVTAYYGQDGGAGVAGDTATAYTLGGNGSGSLNLRASCQGSAAVVPEIGHVIRAFHGTGIPCRHILLFVANGASRATILSRLATLLGSTVNEWPAFSPQPVSILATGNHSSVRRSVYQNASSSTRINYKGEVQATGEGRSAGDSLDIEVGVNQKIVYIPPCIHGALSVGNPSLADIGAAYYASSTVNGSAFSGPVMTVTSYPHASGSTTVIQGGSATPGAASVPSSGLYLTPRGIISAPEREFNRTRVFCEVVDASFFV